MGQEVKELSKKGFKAFNNQNRIIILGWFLSSLVIFATAWFVINNTQEKISESYNSFGLMFAKTLAVETVDLIKGLPVEEKKAKLDNYSQKLMEDNKDINFISFKNAEGELIYSSDFIQKKESVVQINVPMLLDDTVVGSVQIGMTGKSMAGVFKTTRNSMILIFTIMWIISMFAVLINTLLITRQITLLSDGVRRISSGEFGYKINVKDLWGEIKLLFDEFNNMSARLRQYEEKNIDELTFEKNKLEAVLMSIANGVVVCNNYDEVILINNAGLHMLNVEQKDILHSKIQSYCDVNGNLSFEEHIKEFKETPLDEIEKEPLMFQMKLEEKTYKAFISPLFSMNQEYLGYIIVLHDITKEAEIDKIKNHFISNVSHELRTPVTVLRSYIDTLCNFEDEFDEKTKKEFMNIMNQESKRLNNMVNDILDFSRLESPNVKLEKDFIDMKQLIESAVNSMGVLAEERNVQYSIIVEPDIPKLLINEDSIERALKNLLSNALKYSPEGSKIKVRMEVDRTGKNVDISVEDSGIGIEAEYLEKIFDRFFRVENQVHTVKGTGLGLHLVKIAIEKHHNGKVYVESELNVGSKFGFILPIEPDKEELEEYSVNKNKDAKLTPVEEGYLSEAYEKEDSIKDEQTVTATVSEDVLETPPAEQEMADSPWDFKG